MDSSAITVIILTMNEERHIVDVVRNAKKCTPNVLVVDSGSTDRTVELAKQEGAEIAFRAWTNDFAAQQNFALTKVHTPYVLYLDADERLNDELIKHVHEIVAKDDMEHAYQFQRRAVAFNRRFNHGVLRPDWVPRLFPTDKVQWAHKVHPKVITPLPIVNLKGYALHYTYDNWDHYMKKFNSYTKIWAEDAYDRGKRTSLGGVFSHATWSYIKMLILDKGILDGIWGIVLCNNHFFYTFVKYLRLLEIQKNAQENKG